MVKEANNRQTFTEGDIHLGKLFKIVNVFAQEVLFHTLKDLYYHHDLSDKGKKPLEQFCKCVKKDDDKSCKSLRKEMGKNFFPEDFQFYYGEDDDKKEKYLDISCCNNLFRIIKYDFKMLKQSDLTIKIEENLKKIVGLRNELSHYFDGESPPMDKLVILKNNLKTYLNQLCSNMGDIYKENGINYEERYRNLIKKTDNSIEALWNLVIHAHTPEFQELFKSKDNDNLSKFIWDVRKELDTIYERMTSIPFILLQDDKIEDNLEDLFVSPLLSVNSVTLNLNEILTKKLTLSKKATKSSPAPNFVVVDGDAGNGKTTICRKLARDWSENAKNRKKNSDISEYDVLLLIDVKRGSNNGFLRYVRNNLLQESFSNLTEEDILFFLREVKVLTIIDGYDENPKNGDKLFQDVIDKLPNRKVVITTRPNYAQHIYSVIKDKYEFKYLSVQLNGFRDETKFVKKVWESLRKSDEKKVKKLNIRDFTDYLTTLPRDFDPLRKVPFINLLLIYVWINKEGKGNLRDITLTNLYFEVLKLQKNHIRGKLTSLDLPYRDSSSCDTLIDNSVNLLARLCYERFKKRDTNLTVDFTDPIFEKDDFGRLLSEKEREIWRKFFLSTLLKTVPPLKGNSVPHYEFCHKTQYEFLTAYYISKEWEVNEIKYKKDVVMELFKNDLKLHVTIVSFLVGLLGRSNAGDGFIKEIGGIMVENKSNYSSQYNFLWKILYQTISKCDSVEGEEFEVNKTLSKVYKDLFPFQWNLDVEHVISGFSLLHYIEVLPEVLIIDIKPEVDAYDIPYFPITFPDIFKRLQRRQSQRWLSQRYKSKMEIELHFRNYEAEGSPKSVDSFLKLFTSNWSNLAKFSGFVEEEGINILRSHANIGHIGVKIKNIDDLQLLFGACEGKKKLKKLHVFLDKPFGIAEESSFRIPKLFANISITFGQPLENKDKALNFLKKIKPSDSGFYALTVKLVDAPRKWKTFLKSLNDVVMSKLTIQAKECMDHDIYQELVKDIMYELRWY